jgi:predicted ferric reductase
LEAWIRCFPGSQARPTQRKRLEAALHTYLSVKEYENMLWTIFIILLVLWALGLATSYTMGGLIHILLVIAVVVLAIRLFQGRSIA